MNLLTRTVAVEIIDASGQKLVFSNKGVDVTKYKKEDALSYAVGARIEFNVTKMPSDSGNGANVAQIVIYNLKEDTFTLISQTANYINLVCGYNEAINLIFYGKVNNVLRKKVGTDIITTIYCFTNFDKDDLNFVNMSANNIELEDVLKEIAFKNNLTLGIKDYDKFGGKINNYTFFGDVWKQLNLLGLKFGFEWYLDDGLLQILPADRTKPSFTISPTSGLIKTPIRTDAGVDIEMFLNPFIKPSDIFELSSKFSDFNLAGVEYVERVKSVGFSDKREVNTTSYIGVYKVLQLVHEGSTHTNTWYTKIIGHRV